MHSLRAVRGRNALPESLQQKAPPRGKLKPIYIITCAIGAARFPCRRSRQWAIKFRLPKLLEPWISLITKRIKSKIVFIKFLFKKKKKKHPKSISFLNPNRKIPDLNVGRMYSDGYAPLRLFLEPIHHVAAVSPSIAENNRKFITSCPFNPSARFIVIALGVENMMRDAVSRNRGCWQRWRSLTFFVPFPHDWFKIWYYLLLNSRLRPAAWHDRVRSLYLPCK